MKEAPASGPVLLVGDLAADIIATLPDEPPVWRSMTPPASVWAGGTVGNTAMALARLGVPCAVVSATGADAFGDVVRDQLRVAGVDVAHVHRLEGAFTLVILSVSGTTIDRYFWGFPPQGAASTQRRLDQVDRQLIRSARWVHVSGSGLGEPGLVDTLLEAMQFARESSAPVSLDLNIRPKSGELDDQYLAALRQAVELADVVLGSSEDEMTVVTGVEDPYLAAQRATARTRSAVVRLGASGAYVAPALERSMRPGVVPGFPIRLRSSVGAGDVFNAGFIAAQLHGLDLFESARWGNAAAGVACRGEDAYSALTLAAFRELIEGGSRDVLAPTAEG